MSIGSAWLAQEAEGCRRRLISLGVVGCTSVRAFGKFPLMSQWRIHQRNFSLDPLRQRIPSRSRFAAGRLARGWCADLR